MQYDAIVIGTGVGGSVAASILASEGLEVLVLEKNGRTGGVCAHYEKDGFKVDIGTHMFSRGRHGPLGSLARRVGAEPIPFVQPRDLVVVKGFGRELVVPRDAHRYPAFVLRAAYELKLKPSEMVEALRFFSAILRFDEAKIDELDRMTMWEFVMRYTQNPRLVGMFGFLLGLYFILPLNEVSAGEGVWCFKRMALERGLAYPRGGAVAVPDAFLNVARARGAVVETRKTVNRIVVDNGRVAAVECSDGSSYEAPVVVGTTSLKDHVDHLVGAEHFPDEYVQRVRGLKSSMIAVQAKVALRRPLVKAGCIVGIAGDGVDIDNFALGDFDRLYADIQGGRIAGITPIYAPIPTNFDPQMGPKGTQLITACAVAPTTDISLEDEPQRWIDNLKQSLCEMIPGLEKEILFIDTLSTAAIGRWIGKLNAPAVTAGQTPDQVGNRRPSVHTPVLGLYVCGCGAGSRGVGTELAATSGAEAADRVVQDVANGLLPARQARIAVSSAPAAS